MTAARWFDSPHRFKTLALRAKTAACFCKCEVNSTATTPESFSLREIGHDLYLTALATPPASKDQRGSRERGGRANRRRYARWRRFPSDCRI